MKQMGFFDTEIREHHNDIVTQNDTCADIFLSHLQGPATAYHGDGRQDSSDFVSLSGGLGIK